MATDVLSNIQHLDAFKAVNDTHGHSVGDQVLQAVGARMVATLGAEAMVARLGGDEFAIVVPDDDPRGLLWRAGRVRTALGQAITTDVGPLAITVSIGVAVPAVTCSAPIDLLCEADLALISGQGWRRRCLVRPAPRARGPGGAGVVRRVCPGFVGSGWLGASGPRRPGRYRRWPTSLVRSTKAPPAHGS
jgi:diguanylate cyclase (GGDEF)-like protein